MKAAVEDGAPMTITKSEVTCYKMRYPGHDYWADITLDVNKEVPGGRISIASDYGNWTYYWGAPGDNFKLFLSRLNIQYAAGKFGSDKWFDHEKTMKLLKETVKEHEFDTKKAKAVVDELKLLGDASNQHEYVSYMSDCDVIMNMFDHCPPIETSIDPQFKNFWDKFFVNFQSIMKQEG